MSVADKRLAVSILLSEQNLASFELGKIGCKSGNLTRRFAEYEPAEPTLLHSCDKIGTAGFEPAILR